MRRSVIIALLAVAGLGSAATTADAAPPRATLRIVAPSGMRFVTDSSLSPPTFSGSRTFKNLKPGTYTVIQAPPVPGSLAVSCTKSGPQQIVLTAGDDVTCTFSVS